MTPFGPAVWTYALGLSTNGLVTARITEWQGTSLHDIPGLLFYGSAMAVVVLIARRGARTAWPTLAWLAVFFVIGAFAVRGVAWWPLGAVAAVAGVLLTSRDHGPAHPEPLGTPLMRRLNVVVAAVIVLAIVALLPVWRPTEPGLETPRGVVGMAPPGITGALRTMAQPGDHVFNPQPWGSWFEFALPDLPVGIDSRIELFPASTWDAYEGVIAGVDGWQAQLDTWDVAFVVVAKPEEAFARRLTAAGWRQVYSDEDGSLFAPPDR